MLNWEMYPRRFPWTENLLMGKPRDWKLQSVSGERSRKCRSTRGRVEGWNKNPCAICSSVSLGHVLALDAWGEAGFTRRFGKLSDILWNSRERGSLEYFLACFADLWRPLKWNFCKLADLYFCIDYWCVSDQLETKPQPQKLRLLVWSAVASFYQQSRVVVFSFHDLIFWTCCCFRCKTAIFLHANLHTAFFLLTG